MQTNTYILTVTQDGTMPVLSAKELRDSLAADLQEMQRTDVGEDIGIHVQIGFPADTWDGRHTP